MNRVNSKLDTAEHRIGKLEERLIENTQNEAHRGGKKQKNIYTKVKETPGTYSKCLTYVS